MYGSEGVSSTREPKPCLAPFPRRVGERYRPVTSYRDPRTLSRRTETCTEEGPVGIKYGMGGRFPVYGFYHVSETTSEDHLFVQKGQVVSLP